nr:MAG TPA: hypothetical protein [Caudoviricetes sp.]
MLYQVNARGYSPAYYKTAGEAAELVNALERLQIPHNIRIISRWRKMARTYARPDK